MADRAPLKEKSRAEAIKTLLGRIQDLLDVLDALDIDWPAPPKDAETSKTLQDALDGDRDAALEMWRCVERYPEDPSSIVWSREVAHRILAAVPQEDARRRADAIQKAVGLSGRADKHRRLREFIDVMRSFEDLDRKGPPKRGEETQRVIAAIREQAAKDLERKNPADRVFRGCGDEYLKKLTTKEPENSATWDDDDEFLTDLTNLDYLTDHEWQKLISRLRPTFKP